MRRRMSDGWIAAAAGGSEPRSTTVQQDPPRPRVRWCGEKACRLKGRGGGRRTQASKRARESASRQAGEMDRSLEFEGYVRTIDARLMRNTIFTL